MTTGRVLLALIVFYVPYQLRLMPPTDLPGLNLQNLLFGPLFAVGLVRSLRHDPAPIRAAFWFLIGSLALATTIGIARDSSEWVADLTVLKNVVACLALYFAFYHNVADKPTIRFLFAALLGVTLLAALQTARQGLDYGLWHYSEYGRAAGPFGIDWRGANAASTFFVIFLPMFAAVALHYRPRPLLRLLSVACLGLILFAIFVTYSRQAYVLAALLLVLMSMRKNLLLLIPLIVALLSYQAWMPRSTLERIEMTTTGDGVLNERQVDASTESRWIIWQAAFECIKQYPFGVGLNHFQRDIALFVEEDVVKDAHNGFVLMTTEAGWLGLVAMLVLLLAVYGVSHQLRRRATTDEDRVLASALTFSVIGVASGNLFGSRFLTNGEVMGNFWILAALGSCRLSLMSRDAQLNADPPVSKRP